MSAKMLHGADTVIARMLWSNRGLGTDPTPWRLSFGGKGTKPTTTWPVYEGSEPSEPDSVITVYETTPQLGPRVFTGEQQQHYGFTVRVRGKTKAEARQKAEDIRFDFDRSFFDQQITLDSQQYLIPCIARTTLIPFGKGQTPQGTDCWLVNLNCLAVIMAYPVTT